MWRDFANMVKGAIKLWIDSCRDKDGSINWVILVFTGWIAYSGLVGSVPLINALTEFVKEVIPLVIALGDILVVVFKIVQLLTTILSYQPHNNKDGGLFFYGFQKNSIIWH